jgi:DNA-binding transcriptional LysR family regulator
MLIGERHLHAALVADLWFFRVAAETSSFRRAASQLSVTQSAVSQRIKRLEGRLGLLLFTRGPRALSLTPDGQSLLEGVTAGFASLDESLRRLQPAQPAATLRISCAPSLALEWLTPRIYRLPQTHPNIAVTIHAEMHVVDRTAMARDRIDIAVRYENANARPNSLYVASEHREFILPVCAPEYKQKMLTGDAHNSLTILHDATPWLEARADEEWSTWLVAHRLPSALAPHDLFFNLAQLAYRAAVEGAGIAMGRAHIVARYLEEKRLVSAGDDPPIAGAVYRILTCDKPRSRSNIAIVTDWLETQFEETRHTNEALFNLSKESTTGARTRSRHARRARA